MNQSFGPPAPQNPYASAGPFAQVQASRAPQGSPRRDEVTAAIAWVREQFDAVMGSVSRVINRATPKTQSALLEVMEERQVTVEGETHRLDDPFHVLATMNPLDHEGTYPLPAAQLDRFMMMLSMGYPGEMAEVQMLTVHLQPEAVLNDVRAVVSKEDFVGWQRTVPMVYLSEDLKRYTVALIGALRSDPRNLQSISPRSTILLARSAQARAMLRGRDYVTAEDVQMMAPDVLGHRVMLADSRAGREFVMESLGRVAVPQ